MSQKPILVFVAEAHRLLALALQSALSMQEGIRVVGCCHDSGTLLCDLSDSAPDVVLLDESLAGEDFCYLRQVRALPYEQAILLLTPLKINSQIKKAIFSGANAVVNKDIDLSLLVHFIHVLSANVSIVPLKLLPQFPKKRLNKNLDQLTDRELEVMKLLSQGLKNRDIAESLFISEGTVKSHFNSIFSKLQVEDRTQALVQAVALGIIPDTDESTIDILKI